MDKRINVDVLEEKQILPGGLHINHLGLVYYIKYNCFLYDTKTTSHLYKGYKTKILIFPFCVNNIPVYHREFFEDSYEIIIYNYENESNNNKI